MKDHSECNHGETNEGVFLCEMTALRDRLQRCVDIITEHGAPEELVEIMVEVNHASVQLTHGDG